MKNEKIITSEQALSDVFAEWRRRELAATENINYPETPEKYGEIAAAHLIELLRERKCSTEERAES